MRIGSDEHKQRFCRQFIASHCRFDPATLDWPDLDDAALQRLRGIPFWQEVLYTEDAQARSSPRMLGRSLIRWCAKR